MEVKSVYLNLKEGKKNGNVWMLEDEAFKDPIEIKICYDNKELKQFVTTCEALDAKIAKQGERFLVMEGKEAGLQEGLEHCGRMMEALFENSEKSKDKMEGQGKELSELYKAIADAKNTIELQNGTILKLQERVKELEQKTSKQPMVYHDKCFLSGHESSGLGVFELRDGEYLMVLNVKIGEHNEYVNNQDGLIIEKIHVQGQHYIPFYKLEGGTELDKPTATVYYDLVFMPL